MVQDILEAGLSASEAAAKQGARSSLGQSSWDSDQCDLGHARFSERLWASVPRQRTFAGLLAFAGFKQQGAKKGHGGYSAQL